MNGTHTLDGLVAEIEAKAQDAASLREIAGRNPDLIIQFADELRNGTAENGRVVRSGKTHAEVVSEYLKQQKKPVGTSQISKATGLDSSAVRTVLYQDRGNRFKAMKHPEHSTRRLWKLIAERKEANVGVGPSKAVRDYLKAHPEGATAAEVIEGTLEHIRTTSDDKRALVYGTLSWLQRSGKITSEVSKETELKVYRLKQE